MPIEDKPMTFERTEKWIFPEDMRRIKVQLKKDFEEARKAFQNNVKEYEIPQSSYRIIARDGEEKMLLGQGKIIMSDEGKPVRMTGTVQDVTLIKTAERELLKANAKLEERVADRTKDLKQTIHKLEEEILYRKKIEAEIKKLSFVTSKTTNAVLITDKEGTIQWVNDGFIRLSGYSLEDVTGTHGEVLRHGEQTGLFPQNPFFSKVKVEKQSVTYESHNYRKDGSEYWTISTLTPILNDEGEIENIVVIDSDITTRKRTEQELLLAKKSAEESARAKELFLANMSHEIRTPMNAIMGIVQLMQDMDINDAQRKYLRSLRFAGENLLYIINDILDLTKIESGKMNIEKIGFSLSTLVEDLIGAMTYRAKEKNVLLLFDLDRNIPADLIGDPVRLNQVLTNLIGNSIKFTEKGYVKLIIKVIKKENGMVTLRFEVVDTGIGIAKEKQELVFAAFEQAQMETSRKYGGTGLGLSIVKRLVELQGGKVSLESEVGKGSRFFFELAFSIPQKDHVEKEKTAKSEPVTDLGNKRILLVEDNSLNQMVAEKFLEVMGLEIDIAENGAEAVKKLREKNYDLVLMDIQMPVMDGYEATRNIRNEFSGTKKNIPILAMTAHAFQGEEVKCRQVGMNDYIAKPLDKVALIGKVRHLLNSNTHA
jgi:PAS domain S-box-containing protein